MKLMKTSRLFCATWFTLLRGYISYLPSLTSYYIEPLQEVAWKKCGLYFGKNPDLCDGCLGNGQVAADRRALLQTVWGHELWGMHRLAMYLQQTACVSHNITSWFEQLLCAWVIRHAKDCELWVGWQRFRRIPTAKSRKVAIRTNCEGGRCQTATGVVGEWRHDRIMVCYVLFGCEIALHHVLIHVDFLSVDCFIITIYMISHCLHIRITIYTYVTVDKMMPSWILWGIVIRARARMMMMRRRRDEAVTNHPVTVTTRTNRYRRTTGGNENKGNLCSQKVSNKKKKKVSNEYNLNIFPVSIFLLGP